MCLFLLYLNVCVKERKNVTLIFNNDRRDTNLFLFEKKILLLLMRDIATKRIRSLVIWSLLHTNDQNCSNFIKSQFYISCLRVA